MCFALTRNRDNDKRKMGGGGVGDGGWDIDYASSSPSSTVSQAIEKVFRLSPSSCGFTHIHARLLYPNIRERAVQEAEAGNQTYGLNMIYRLLLQRVQADSDVNQNGGRGDLPVGASLSDEKGTLGVDTLLDALARADAVGVRSSPSPNSSSGSRVMMEVLVSRLPARFRPNTLELSDLFAVAVDIDELGDSDTDSDRGGCAAVSVAAGEEGGPAAWAPWNNPLWSETTTWVDDMPTTTKALLRTASLVAKGRRAERLRLGLVLDHHKEGQDAGESESEVVVDPVSSHVLSQLGHQLYLDRLERTTTAATTASVSSETSSKGTEDGSARLLCLTYTHAPRHRSVRAISATWGADCDGYLAFSDVDDPDNGILKIRSEWVSSNESSNGDGESLRKESYDDMWMKSVDIWRIVRSGLMDDYDYFLIGGDDLFVAVGHLRHLLTSTEFPYRQRHERGDPLYIGRRLWANKYTSFASGGAGYVLNSAALRRLIHLITVTTASPTGGGAEGEVRGGGGRWSGPANECFVGLRASMEDVLVAQCLSHAGVALSNPGERGESGERAPSTNDATSAATTQGTEQRSLVGEQIFHPLLPIQAWTRSEGWYVAMAAVSPAGPACCSARSATFQNVTSPRLMRRYYQLFMQAAEKREELL